MDDHGGKRMAEWLDYLRDQRLTRRQVARAAGRVGFAALAAANARWLSRRGLAPAEAGKS